MSSNRRQFFRIHQQVALELTLAGDGATASSGPGQFEVPSAFNILSDLQNQQSDAQILLHRIKERDPAMSEFLQLMNRRIDTLTHAILNQQIDFSRLITRDVNLSEGGMLFYYPDALPTGATVSLKLIFPESQLGLQLSASILRCDPIETGEFEVALEFQRLPESTRAQLARQIMETQVLSRRNEIA